MRDVCDAARAKASSPLIFLRCASNSVHVYALILREDGKIFMSPMAKVLSFPFLSVISISSSEIVQLIRVCSRFLIFSFSFQKVLIKTLDFNSEKM